MAKVMAKFLRLSTPCCGKRVRVPFYRFATFIGDKIGNYILDYSAVINYMIETKETTNMTTKTKIEAVTPVRGIRNPTCPQCGKPAGPGANAAIVCHACGFAGGHAYAETARLYKAGGSHE